MKLKYTTIGIFIGVVMTCLLLLLLYWLFRLDVAKLSVEEIKKNRLLSGFVHGVEKLESGTFDMDINSFEIVLHTNIPTADEYFELVRATLNNKEWREVDRHKSYAKYMQSWSETGYGAERYEVEIHYAQNDKKVYMEADHDLVHYK